MYKVNLLPVELLTETEGVPRKIQPRVILVAFAGFLCLLYAIFGVYLFIGRAQVEQKRHALAALEPQIQRVEALQNEAVTLKARAAVWQKIISDRRTYYLLLADFQYSLPVDMWLTGVEIFQPEPQTPPGAAPNPPQPQAAPQALPQPTRVTVEGGTNSLASVGVYLNNLCRLPYFKSVTLKELKEIKTGGQERVTVFTIEAALKEGGWR